MDQAFKAPRIGLGDKENSKKDPEEPNGLANNDSRCYANAALQLLAACFAKEIKSLPRYPENANKRQIRDNLLMIVDHINAKERQKPNNGRVLQAVRDLTTSIGTTDNGAGTASEVILLLGNLLLGFAPNYTVISYEKELLSDGFGDPDLDAAKEHVMPEQTHCLPRRPQIITYCSEKVVNKLSLRWKEFSKLIQQNSVTVRDLVQDIQQQLRQTLEQPDPSRGEVELKYMVEFSRLEDKLPAGSKLVLHNHIYQSKESASFDITFYGASAVIPYSKDFKKRQKFDLVGLVVHSGFHYVAYVKREGIWYLVNDAQVFKVSEEEMSQLFKRWLAESEKPQWGLPAFASLHGV